MSVVHISEQDLIADPASAIARADAGDEITIDRKEHGRDLRLSLARSADEVDGLTYLSEFRQRHPESLDATRWD